MAKQLSGTKETLRAKDRGTQATFFEAPEWCLPYGEICIDDELLCEEELTCDEDELTCPPEPDEEEEEESWPLS